MPRTLVGKVIPRLQTSDCAIELQCQLTALDSAILYKGSPNLTELAFDIKCRSHGNQFPKATLKADAVIQIGNVVSRQHQPEERVLFTIAECNRIEDATIRSFPNEEALLEAWYTFLEQTDPDFIIGYNVVKFDLRYLEDSARLHQIPQAGLLGRQRTATSSFTPMRIRREGLGEISTYMMKISGRVVMNTWVLSWMNHHFPKYTLQDFSRTLLGEDKSPIDIGNLAHVFDSSTSTGKAGREAEEDADDCHPNGCESIADITVAAEGERAAFVK